MPDLAPASMAMFAIVKRPLIGSCPTTGPVYSNAQYVAPSTPTTPSVRRIKSLADTHGRSDPS